MIQAKTDAALLVDPEGLLTGILTDRVRAYCGSGGSGTEHKLTRVCLLGHCLQSRGCGQEPLDDLRGGRHDAQSVLRGVARERNRCAQEDGLGAVSPPACDGPREQGRGYFGHCQVPLRGHHSHRARLRRVFQEPEQCCQEGM